ncbi:MAG: ATP-binding protein [Desulfobacteraceae bacterium]|nr:ATP-binding protein [Desulfobacteraceae bacterium]
MNFRFVNIGPLKEADLELRPLTIIGGVNQVGKSFITKFLYGILSTKASPTEEQERADKFRRIFQQRDFRKLKNRYSGELGLVALEDRIMFLTALDTENKEELLKKAVENEPENKTLLSVYEKFLKKQDIDEAKDKPGGQIKKDMESSSVTNDFKKVSYISTPAVLDAFRPIVTFRGDKGGEGLSDIYWDPLKDIIGSGEPLEEIKLRGVYDKLENITGGRIIYELTKGFRFLKGKEEFGIDSVAFGIKLFGMLQMLIQRNIIVPNGYLLLEEPEIHLHPSLTFKLVQIIKELVDKGVYVIITTHSPELIRYVEYMINTGKLNPAECSFLNLKFNEDKLTSSGKSQSAIESADDILLSLTEGFYKVVLAEEMGDEDILNGIQGD